MRTVIEAGRKTSPLINEAIPSVREGLSECLRLISEKLSNVSGGKTSKDIETLTCIVRSVSCDILKIEEAWACFDGTLGEYKYRFNRSKKKIFKDLPGQQLLFN